MRDDLDGLASAGPEFLNRLEAALPGRVAAPTPAYLEEARGRFTGVASAIVRPHTADEVARTVRLAAQARVGIVPYAGGTGLVGGQTAQGPAVPILLSVEKMDRVLEVNTQDNVAVVEAGAILANVHAAVEDKERLFPLWLASQGSARIGGLLATNAGGVQVLRYGSARDLCLGLEVVMADGTLWHGLKRLRKDNTGYDLRHLMIGSEGTLGIITGACLKLSPKPVDIATALVEVGSPAQAIALLNLLRDHLGETVSAFELMHSQGLAFLAEHLPQIAQPFGNPPTWSALVEVGGGRGADMQTRLEQALVSGAEGGLVGDALLAQSDSQRKTFWEIRENIPQANRKVGAVSNHDISLPVSAVPEFVARGGPAIAAIDPGLRINAFGHLGDGNLHYNVFPAPGRARAEYEALRPAIKEAVHDLVHALGGSVSAEHGIGRMKVGDLQRYSDPAKLAAMRALKSALDPLGILNPGALFGDEK
ncbi:MAG: FAD-binding oxidoreductase [Pseudomonadota bacterium]